MSIIFEGVEIPTACCFVDGEHSAFAHFEYCRFYNVCKQRETVKTNCKPSNCPVKALEQEPFINKPCVSSGACEHDKQMVLNKIRAEITDCLKALDEIEKSGFNIYLPNEMSGRRLTYQQCLEFIDKYKAESDPQESEDKK